MLSWVLPGVATVSVLVSVVVSVILVAVSLVVSLVVAFSGTEVVFTEVVSGLLVVRLWGRFVFAG